jgi:hypothetical protein
VLVDVEDALWRQDLLYDAQQPASSAGRRAAHGGAELRVANHHDVSLRGRQDFHQAHQHHPLCDDRIEARACAPG